MTKTDKIIRPMLIALVISVFFAIMALTNMTVRADDEFKQLASTPNTVSIQWKAASDAECYYIGYGADFKEAKTMVDSKKLKVKGDFTDNASTVLKDLKAGTKYIVYISYKVKVSGVTQSLIEDASIHTSPAKVTGVKVAEVDNPAKTATFSWKTQAGASGYEYVLMDNIGVEVAKGKIPSGTESLVKLNIDTNVFYRFEVRAYQNRFGSEDYGDWSTAVYFSAHPEFTKVAATSKGISLKWAKTKGAKNYTIYASTKPKSGYKKIATTTKNTYTIKKIGSTSKFSNNKKYYVYIIADKTAKKKTFTTVKNAYYEITGTSVTPHLFAQ